MWNVVPKFANTGMTIATMIWQPMYQVKHTMTKPVQCHLEVRTCPTVVEYVHFGELDIRHIPNRTMFFIQMAGY